MGIKRVGGLEPPQFTPRKKLDSISSLVSKQLHITRAIRSEQKFQIVTYDKSSSINTENPKILSLMTLGEPPSANERRCGVRRSRARSQYDCAAPWHEGCGAKPPGESRE